MMCQINEDRNGKWNGHLESITIYIEKKMIII